MIDKRTYRKVAKRKFSSEDTGWSTGTWHCLFFFEGVFLGLVLGLAIGLWVGKLY